MSQKKGDGGFAVKDRRSGFAIIDNALIDDYGPEIGAYCIAAYCILVRFARADGTDAYPSYQKVADLMNTSRRTAIRAIKKLTELGLIEKEGRRSKGESLSNAYILVDITKVQERQVVGSAPQSPPSVTQALPSALQSPGSAPQSPDQYTITIHHNKRVDQGVSRAIATPPTPTPPATPKVPLLPNDGYEMPSPPTNGHAKKYARVTSDYYDPRRLVDGYIPAGQGTTAIEVYHEWVAPTQRRLSQPNQADITQQATDLERWRQAVKAWVQSGHRPENVKGLLDWYHDPSRIPGNKPTNGKPAQPEVTFKQWLLNTYHSTFAATIKPESELRDEYRQWRKANGLPPAG